MRHSLASDARGASITLNYVLAIGIVTLLITGLVTAAAGNLDGQRQQATRAQLDAIGNTLASELASADRLSRRGAAVTFTSDQPKTVVGGGYDVTLSTGSDCTDPGVDTCLRLDSQAQDVSVVVPVGNESPVSLTRLDSGRWQVSATTDGTDGTAAADVALGGNRAVTRRIGVGRDVRPVTSDREVVDPTNRRPIAGFSFTPGSPTVENTIEFTNETRDLDGRIVSYDWRFGDGVTATGPKPTHSYGAPGKYNITLTITDNDNDTATISKQVSVSGVLYNDDAVAVDHDGDGTPGGIEFSVENRFDAANTPDISDDEVTLTEILVDPEDDSLDRVYKGDGLAHEVQVETDGDSSPEGYVDYTFGTDVADGGLITDLDADNVDGIDDAGPNPTLASGESATIRLSEFRPDTNVSGKPITVVVRYRVDGQYFSTRFTIKPDIDGTTDPDAYFDRSPISPDVDESVSFDASTSADPDGSIVSYNWRFGDGDTATGMTTSHSFGAPGSYSVALTVTDDSGYMNTTTQTVDVGTGAVVFAVNSGGAAYTGSDGVDYSADAEFGGGNTYSIGNSIANTTDDTLYQSERYGDFTYDVTLPDGTYEVTLKFAEIYHSSDGQRQFDVALEGNQVVTNLDIHSQVGADRSYVLTRQATVSDGELTIAFNTDVDNAKVSAIVVREAGGGGSPDLAAPPLDVDSDAAGHDGSGNAAGYDGGGDR